MTPTQATLALNLAETSDALEAAAQRFAQASESLSQLETWRQYQQALAIVQALRPQVPQLPGYSEYEAASQAREQAVEAHRAALEAWRQRAAGEVAEA